MNKKFLMSLVAMSLIATMSIGFSADPLIEMAVNTPVNESTSIGDVVLYDVDLTLTNTTNVVCFIDVDGAGAITMLNDSTTHFYIDRIVNQAKFETAIVNCTGYDYPTSNASYLEYTIVFDRDTYIDFILDGTTGTIGGISMLGVDLVTNLRNSTNISTLASIVFLTLIGAALIGIAGIGTGSLKLPFLK